MKHTKEQIDLMLETSVALHKRHDPKFGMYSTEQVVKILSDLSTMHLLVDFYRAEVRRLVLQVSDDPARTKKALLKCKTLALKIESIPCAAGL